LQNLLSCLDESCGFVTSLSPTVCQKTGRLRESGFIIVKCITIGSYLLLFFTFFCQNFASIMQVSLADWTPRACCRTEHLQKLSFQSNLLSIEQIVTVKMVEVVTQRDLLRSVK